MTDSNVTTPVAVIIPALKGEPQALLESVRRQTCRPAEVEVVVGVRPNGRARNVGVSRTSAPYLVFVDDDAVLGDEHVIERLTRPLQDTSVGVTGASKLIPPDSSWFQRRVAREVARIEHPVVPSDLESNPDPPYFYSEITTTCCAMRREVFDQVGGFDETLLRGVDTEFFVRVRRRGYRFLLVADTWAWHPAPATLGQLLRKQFLYGVGHAQEVRRDPGRARGLYLRTPLHAAAYFLARSAFLIPNTFLPFSFASPSWRPGFRPIKALASYVSALGYLWGWYRTQ